MTRKGDHSRRDITWAIDGNGCWNCTSHHQTKLIYPRVKIDGKQVRINRYHYQKYNGDIPVGMVVRHTCDNKRCINPEHLIIGTDKDNAMDAMERDLCPRGEKHWHAKLTWAIVNKIRTSPDRPCDLSREFGVTYKHLYNIRMNRSWKEKRKPA